MEKSQNRKPFQALRDLFHPVDLTHGTCWRTILQFSLPVILSYLLQACRLLFCRFGGGTAAG